MNADLAPYIGRVTTADARALPIPDRSVPVAIFSPPYWGLREYGDDEQELGRGTLDGYIDETVAYFDELGRVLTDDGLAWVNIGDTRTGSGGAGGDYSTGSKKHARPFRQGAAGLPRGQWAQIPHRVTIALQARGWLVIADVTWSKGKVRLRNGVPELVTRRRPEDLKHVRRPGISSERIFLLAKTLGARRRFRPSMLEELGDVWTFPPDGNRKLAAHAAPYPEELVRRCLLPTTLPGDVVLDPFAGRGTTLRVAERHGRLGIGFDLYTGTPVDSAGTDNPVPAAAATGSVVGCVWGAHRRLAEELGGGAPTYAWCEARWSEIRGRAPDGKGLADWLFGELADDWIRETCS